MAIKSKISLCAIVKDQVVLLRRLLEHHRNLFDEAVIVDTGSADDSFSVAAELGAVVDHFPWCDDFSAARNHGLDMATGDWILVLDCDEIISQEDFPRLRALVADPTRTCFKFPQLNYFPVRRGPGWEPAGPEHEPYCLGASGYVTAWSIRLFPNRKALRFRGVVHESLAEGVRSAGLNIKACDAPIHHQGHLPGMEHRADRTIVNGRLLARKIRNQPEDPSTRYEMATFLAGVGHISLAVRLLEKTLTDFPNWPDKHRVHLLLGQIRSAQGALADAATHYQAALAARPDWPACWEAVITNQLSLGSIPEAGRYLDQARQLFPERAAWRGFEAQVPAEIGR